MKDKVERLAKGNFEYEQPEVLVSEEALFIEVAAGEDFCGKFFVRNRHMSVMKGVVYSSNEMLVINESQFQGNENEITYTVQARYGTPGEERRGHVTIVSEYGEIAVPFTIRVLPVCLMSSEGEVRDLFQFAGLAQNNWFEAKKLFADSRFVSTVLADREEEATVYRQLMHSKQTDYALEEFLIFIKKKTPIQIKADKTSIRFSPGKTAVMERITIAKDTWGYTDVTVETEGDFFLVSAKKLHSESFNNNRCLLEVAVDGSVLSEGTYFGAIYLKTPRNTVRVDVVCTCEKTVREGEEKRRAFRKTEAKLFGRYFDFRMGKVKSGSYIAEAESMVELLLLRLQENIFPENVTREKELSYRMYRAYLAIIGKKDKNAETEINKIKALYEKMTPTARLSGALCYLEAMQQKTPEGVKEYADRIKELCIKEDTDGLLLWFRLYTDKRNENVRAQCIEELKARFEKGNTSPLLYFETAVLWNEEPALLKELGNYELQVLLFALKRNLLQKETVLQFAILAMQAEKGNGLLLRCLELAYARYSQRDALQALCTCLIAAGRRERRYHSYFADACGLQLRIPLLQEYYIYTCGCDETTKIDQSVLLYFTYGNELEEPYAGFLYAYIVRNKEALSSFYRTYAKRMEQYAVESIKAGRIDRNLAVVYEDVLRLVLTDAEMAATLPGIMFSYEIECDNREIKAVSVLHKEEEAECIVPFTEGRAVFRMYTEDACVALIDGEGNYVLPDARCRITRLFHGEEYLSRCYELAGDQPMVLLNLLEKVHNFHTVDVDAVELSKRIVHVEGLSEAFRQKELYSLIRYCYDKYQGELLDGYLNRLNLDCLDRDDRNHVIELLIIRGRYDLAVDALMKYGMTGVSSKRILRLCERMLLQCEGEQNDTLLLLCRHCFFDGKFDENMLRYLVTYFYGTTEEMYQIWLRAMEFELQTEVLEERLLGQILFADAYVPNAQQVFLSYRKKRGNRKLIRAYLSKAAYRRFLLGCELPEELFEEIRIEAEENNEICCLAVLREYAERESLTEEQARYAEQCMNLFAEKGMIFPFFTMFEGKAALPPCMEDKVYVEYRTNPEHKVKISYLYDADERDNFRCEPMRHVGYGIFAKEFILFYEEVLQYYISEEYDGQSQITESFYREVDAVKVHDETTKYGQINLILTAQDMNDEKTMMDMLENYYRREYSINRLFTPIKE